jgi:hypothetical protein
MFNTIERPLLAGSRTTIQARAGEGAQVQTC